LSIVTKLAKIQQELHAPKNQKNTFGNYSYRSCEDILQAVKPLLGDCIILCYDEIQEVSGRVYVKATAEFSDGKDTIKNTAFAREPLSKKGMDESQITGAASSYARKYALNGLLLIDDNKDADTQSKHNAEEEYEALVLANRASIDCIKEGIGANDYSTAREAWVELGQEVQTALWKAPSKGGCFTTEERKIMQTPEFREA